MMQVADFYNTTRARIEKLGGEGGTTIWLNPADWDNFLEGLGPPREIREQQARARGLPVAPRVNSDGANVGRFQSCTVHVHSEIPAGIARLRNGDAWLDYSIGPFAPAAEPAGGWLMPLRG